MASTPQKVEIVNAQKKNLAKCSKIKNESEDYFHTTGQLSFYLGYPIVAIPLALNKSYLAPLFLWAISCKITATSIIFDRVRDEDKNALDPQLNRILQVWLAHEKNVQLKWNNAEELTWENIPSETKIALSAWVNCQSDLDTNQIKLAPDKESLKTLVKAKVMSSAIIGYIPIKGQALLDDLDKLLALLSENSIEDNLLDYF